MAFNLHPPLTAFPLVLFLLAAFLEVAAWRRGLDWHQVIETILIAAVIGSAGAFFSGYQASDLADQTFVVPNEAISWHHTCGRVLLFLSLPCAALRFVMRRAAYNRGVFRAAYGVTLGVCCALVVYTGWLGGRLVFAHGAGVYAPLPVQSPPAP